MMTAACLRTIAAAGLSVRTATTAAAAAALLKRCHTTGKTVLLVVVAGATRRGILLPAGNAFSHALVTPNIVPGLCRVPRRRENLSVGAQWASEGLLLLVTHYDSSLRVVSNGERRRWLVLLPLCYERLCCHCY
jgi:hypothetical protein